MSTASTPAEVGTFNEAQGGHLRTPSQRIRASPMPCSSRSNAPFLKAIELNRNTRRIVLSILATALLMSSCSDDSSKPAASKTQTTTPTPTTTVAAPTPPPSFASPVFEGLDPCTLLTPEEAADATGGPAIVPFREPEPYPEILWCTWGAIEHAEDGHVEVTVTLDDFEMLDVFGEINGIPVTIVHGADEKFCALGVVLSGERRMLLSLIPAVPGAAAPEIIPGVRNTKWCDDTLELLEIAVDRTGW